MFKDLVTYRNVQDDICDSDIFYSSFLKLLIIIMYEIKCWIWIGHRWKTYEEQMIKIAV